MCVILAVYPRVISFWGVGASEACIQGSGHAGGRTRVALPVKGQFPQVVSLAFLVLSFAQAGGFAPFVLSDRPCCARASQARVARRPSSLQTVLGHSRQLALSTLFL